MFNIATFGKEGSSSALLTACFKAGTYVKTKTGEKKIEEINRGDKVWTTNGWESVITPTILKNKEIMTIKTRNSTNKEINCTPDHEFLTVGKTHKGRIKGVFNKEKAQKIFPELKNYGSTEKEYGMVYGNFREADLEWTKASDINKEIHGVKKIDFEIVDTKSIKWKNQMKRDSGIGISENIKINEEFCELIGMWLAEGSSNNNSITFNIHQDEKDFKNRIIELMWKVFQLDNYYIYDKPNSKALTISYSSRQLISFMSQLFEVEKIKDKNQWNKTIPTILMKIKPELQLQIFKGWFIGDGYVRKKTAKQNFQAKGTTASKKLAEDMICILNRNFINPFVIIEKRSKKSTIYNIKLYGKKTTILYNMKYNSNFKEKLSFPLESLSYIDIPFLYDNELYLKTKLEQEKVEREKTQEDYVYCLKVPSENFTVNDTIVHNCRGLKINDDIAHGLTSLIPSSRGIKWSLKDCFFGNEKDGKEPVTELVNEVDRYNKLKEVALGIEGLINKRSSHAGGVFIFQDGIIEQNAMMKSPSGLPITQWDMNDSEKAGGLKFDLLTVKSLDAIRITLDLLIEDDRLKWQGSLKETYDKYLHPDVLEYDNKEMWKMASDGEIISLFQMDTNVGSQAISRSKPTNVVELAQANSIMRLASDDEEQPLDIFERYKADITEWYREMEEYGLNEEEQEILRSHLEPFYGIATTQEDIMLMSMDKRISGFSVELSNKLRKGVAKKKQKVLDSIKLEFYSEIHKKQGSKTKEKPREIFLDYIWNVQFKRQFGLI